MSSHAQHAIVSSDTQSSGAPGSSSEPDRHGKRKAPEFTSGREISPVPAQSPEASGSTGPVIVQPSDQEREISGRLEKIIDEFCHGSSTKIDAITAIIATISESNLDEKFKQGSITSYILLIGDIEEKEGDREKRAHFREAAERSCEASGSAPTQEESSQENRDGAEPGGGGDIRTQRDRLISSVSRVRSEDEGSQYDSDKASGSESSQPKSKKRHIKEDDLPWFAEEKQAREEEDSRCRENRRLLRLYIKNPAKIKEYISISHVAPCNFPSTEWDKLIRGELADFDTIYSSIHHIGAPQENRGRIGDSEIVFGHGNPLRKVEDH
ncbi:hypothetical protein C0992_009454, partial [Termitomyces sp. T32_za158]